jgi:hypothetical protein
MPWISGYGHVLVHPKDEYRLLQQLIEGKITAAGESDGTVEALARLVDRPPPSGLGAFVPQRDAEPPPGLSAAGRGRITRALHRLIELYRSMRGIA